MPEGTIHENDLPFGEKQNRVARASQDADNRTCIVVLGEGQKHGAPWASRVSGFRSWSTNAFVWKKHLPQEWTVCYFILDCSETEKLRSKLSLFSRIVVFKIGRLTDSIETPDLSKCITPIASR